MANPTGTVPTSIASRQAIDVILAVTPANTPKNLYSLLAAVSGLESVIRNSCELLILNSGGTTIARGRSSMTAVTDGQQILPLGWDREGPYDKNILSLTNVWLISDADNGQVVVNALSA